jgi:peroxiredoxin
MAQLSQDYQKFVEHDAEVVAVGPEDAESFKKWWREHQMPFIGIPDPDHVIADLYKQESKLLKGGRLPSLTVVDKEGKVRLMHHGDSMSDIPSDEKLFSLLEDLNKEIPARN